jgi:hypothetical protein
MHGWNLLQATCRFNTLAGTQPPYCASDGATLMKASLGVADVYACARPTQNGVSLQLEELLVLIGVVRSVQPFDTIVVFSFTRHISSAIVVSISSVRGCKALKEFITQIVKRANSLKLISLAGACSLQN